jgi:aspartokinase-like uncharacterized kinase
MSVRLPNETPPPTVVKVGGSLLRLADFPQRFLSWLRSQPSCPLLLLAGGGAAADDVRRAADAWDLTDAAAHWLAIRALSFQSHLLSAVLPGLRVCNCMEDCRVEWLAGRREVVFDPWPLLEESADELPADWNTTSDSIAAWLAGRIDAERLVLLKSVGGEAPITCADAAARGWIDDHFANVVGDRPVAWVNLREGRSSRLLPVDGRSA